MLSEVLFEDKSSAGTSGVFDMWGHTVACVYLVFSSGVSGGTVVVETAHSRTYGGTWEQVQQVTATASSVKRVGLSGAYKAVRVRIANQITGGTVSAYAEGYR